MDDSQDLLKFKLQKFEERRVALSYEIMSNEDELGQLNLAIKRIEEDLKDGIENKSYEIKVEVTSPAHISMSEIEEVFRRFLEPSGFKWKIEINESL